MKKITFKAMFMIILILTLPLYIPITMAATRAGIYEAERTYIDHESFAKYNYEFSYQIFPETNINLKIDLLCTEDCSTEERKTIKERTLLAGNPVEEIISQDIQQKQRYDKVELTWTSATEQGSKMDSFFDGSTLPDECDEGSDGVTCEDDSTVTDPEQITLPGEQCLDKADQGKDFVDFMDSGIIRALEAISGLLFTIAQIVNFIDSALTLISGAVGHQGPDVSSSCCLIGFFPGGLAICTTLYGVYNDWHEIKANPIMSGVLGIATCACCSNPSNGNDDWVDGSIAGICPLGFATDAIGGIMPTFTSFEGEDVTNQIIGKGTAKFHLSAFDNIYTAVGCLCPVAILFNLRKLKTIYQVNTCCVEESCKLGISTEGCAQQLDEALCMYWEGAIYKSLAKIVASVLAGYMAKFLYKQLVKTPTLAKISSCILFAAEALSIKSKWEAITSGLDWFSSSFEDPSCEELGIQMENALDSSYLGANQGISDTIDILYDEKGLAVGASCASGECGVSSTPSREIRTLPPGTILFTDSVNCVFCTDMKKDYNGFTTENTHDFYSGNAQSRQGALDAFNALDKQRTDAGKPSLPRGLPLVILPDGTVSSGYVRGSASNDAILGKAATDFKASLPPPDPDAPPGPTPPAPAYVPGEVDENGFTVQHTVYEQIVTEGATSTTVTVTSRSDGGHHIAYEDPTTKKQVALIIDKEGRVTKLGKPTETAMDCSSGVCIPDFETPPEVPTIQDSDIKILNSLGLTDGNGDNVWDRTAAFETQMINAPIKIKYKNQEHTVPYSTDTTKPGYFGMGGDFSRDSAIEAAKYFIREGIDLKSKDIQAKPGDKSISFSKDEKTFTYVQNEDSLDYIPGTENTGVFIVRNKDGSSTFETSSTFSESTAPKDGQFNIKNYEYKSADDGTKQRVFNSFTHIFDSDGTWITTQNDDKGNTFTSFTTAGQTYRYDSSDKTYTTDDGTSSLDSKAVAKAMGLKKEDGTPFTEEEAQTAIQAKFKENRDAFEKEKGLNKKENEEAAAKRKALADALDLRRREELAAMTVAYGLAWELLDFLLSDFLFPEIDAMCKEEYTASTPTGDNEDVTGSTGQSNQDLPDGCEYLDEDCADQFQATSIPSVDSYDFSFAVGACTEDIDYELYVKREDGNNPLRLDEGTVFKGVVCDFSMPDRTGLAPYTYTIPCIKANGVEHCFG